MQNTMSRFRPALAMLVLLAGGIGLAPSAHAAILSISGAAFVQQCPCAPSGNLPDVTKGGLFPTDQSNLYAAVDFPTNGQKICSLSLVYQDINANDTMTARLFRKAFAVGRNPLNNPTIIVTAKSAGGVVNTVRKTTTKTATPPTINDASGFYFVEVSMPTINLNLLGVQIDYRPTCP